MWEQVLLPSHRSQDQLKQEVALYFGKLLWKQKKPAQAREVWSRGVQFNPESRHAREINQQIEVHRRD